MAGANLGEFEWKQVEVVGATWVGSGGSGQVMLLTVSRRFQRASRPSAVTEL